jgi:hypothetical protein
MHSSSSAREAAKEAEDDIRFDADLKARALPAVDAWVKQHTTYE